MSKPTVVSVPRLQAFGQHVATTSKTITDQAQQMTAELQRTLAEWGEGTDSRAAFNEFKRRVDACIEDMNAALAQMPGAISEAAAEAERAERSNTRLFA